MKSGTQGLVRTLQVTHRLVLCPHSCKAPGLAWAVLSISQSLIASSLLWVMQNHTCKRS